MRKLLGAFIVLFGITGVVQAEAKSIDKSKTQADNNPAQIMEDISTKMISLIKKNQNALKKDSTLAETLVKENLVPVLDMKTFSRKTLGKKVWNSISEKQQNAFVDGFVNRVISKYAKFLALYDGQSFEFAKPRYSKSKKGAIVKSTMKQAGEEPLDISYRLSKRSGDWLVTNITVAGTDMRKSYKTQFLPRIKAIGIDNFDQFIVELNTPPEKKK